VVADLALPDPPLPAERTKQPPETAAELLARDAKRRAAEQERSEALLREDQLLAQHRRNERLVERLRPQLVEVVRDVLATDLPEAVHLILGEMRHAG
jgi:hypothetical protein